MGYISGGEGDDKPVQIGIDREGGLHLFNESTNRIRVYEEYPHTEPAYEYDLNAVNKSIIAWIAYVKEKRGWKQRSFITAQDLYEGMKLRQQEIG